MQTRADGSASDAQTGTFSTDARELAALLGYVQSRTEKDKAELARRLHDELGGLLTAAKMDLSWLQARVEAGPLQERLKQLGAALDEAMDLKRRVVEELRPSLLEHFGLATALRTHAQSTCARAGLALELLIGADCDNLAKDAALTLFRVAQEGLSNTVRHAQARTARLELTRAESGCTLSLTDDGRSFDVSAGLPATGALAALRQRVASLGGDLRLDARAGGGTVLRAQVPAG
ncbi:MAG TPA: sensor histidine kinase [Steroidobacteraceae bacterium]|nr:sensor histidine kinase [Steroidobacteraceae bacterium]